LKLNHLTSNVSYQLPLLAAVCSTDQSTDPPQSHRFNTRLPRKRTWEYSTSTAANTRQNCQTNITTDQYHCNL